MNDYVITEYGVNASYTSFYIVKAYSEEQAKEIFLTKFKNIRDYMIDVDVLESIGNDIFSIGCIASY